MNYFIFNKALDYSRGTCWNTEYDDSGLRIRNTGSGEAGVFLSRILDGGEEETVWHRLTLDVWMGGNMAVSICVYGSDDMELAARCRGEFEKEMEEKGFSFAKARMDRCRKVTILNPCDFLLWEVKARYLWFTVLLQGTPEGSPQIGNVTVYFPKQSWLTYLPEVYKTQENSFLERFLAVFSVLYGDLEQRIRTGHRRLDLKSADEGQLLWLAGWLGMTHVHLWPPEHLKRYLAQGAGSFRSRGTGKGLLELVEAYTGERAYIKEGMDGEAGIVTVYVSEKSAARQADYRALLAVVKDGLPASLQVRIVVLRPWIRLGFHTYLGVNSRITSYQTAALNGVSQLGMVLAGGRK